MRPSILIKTVQTIASFLFLVRQLKKVSTYIQILEAEVFFIP
jgi:hypothetical protein